jgi:23S rRNA (guanosine2251-2'-O)-methyltransferase
MSQWIHGLHAVLEALQATPGKVQRVVAAAAREDGRLKEVLEAARRARIPVRRQPSRAIDRLAGSGASHQGVVALIAESDYADAEQVLERAGEPALLLVLDGVEDPRNLGAVIRSAAAFGAGGLFLPSHRAAGLSPGSLKASAGTALRFPVARLGNVVAFLERLKERGIWVVGLAEEGEPIWSGFDLRQPVALVLGAEGKGLRRLAREHCDALLGIPVGPGSASLNLSVAAGVALFEVVRQRRASG